MNTHEFTVAGMTCGHCVQSVTEEVSEVPGVVSVNVVLDTGALTVTGDADPAAVLAAVAEAGYQAEEARS
jgi:copper chaperone CopZ